MEVASQCAFQVKGGRGRAWCAAHFFPGPGTPCSNASSVHQCLMMAAEDGRRRLKGRIEAPPVGRPHPIHPGRGRSLTYVRSSIVNMTQRRRCHATIYLGLMGTWSRLRRREREGERERRENEWLREEEAQKGKNDEGTAF